MEGDALRLEEGVSRYVRATLRDTRVVPEAVLTKQQAQVETSLFAEFDRLSSLWETLDQHANKVF